MFFIRFSPSATPNRSNSHRSLLISLALRHEEPPAEHVHRRVVDLLPAVEAAALGEGAHGVGEGVV